MSMLFPVLHTKLQIVYTRFYMFFCEFMILNKFKIKCAQIVRDLLANVRYLRVISSCALNERYLPRVRYRLLS